MLSSNSPVVYKACSDTPPGKELNALVAVYTYLLNKNLSERTPTPDGCDTIANLRNKKGGNEDRDEETNEKSYQGTMKGK